MATVYTVQAKLDGTAAGLAAAGKQAETALTRVKAAAEEASASGGKLESSFRTAGSNIVGGIGTVVSAIAKIGAAAVAAGALAGGALAFTALKGGLSRLETIQDATVSLTRMMGNAADAATLTSAALKVVTGTPFALPDFDQAARQLYAYGVQAQKIPGMLQAIADSAAASGQGTAAVSGLSSAFADMAVEGKVNLQTLQEFGTAGVNGIGILANHFGLTTQAMEHMISFGFVPSGEAMDALVSGIENGSHGIAGDFNSISGAAQDLGHTVSGSLGNLKTAFARAGADILTPFTNDLPNAINNGVIPLLDKLGGQLGKVSAQIANTGALEKFTNLMKSLGDKIGPAIGTFEAFARALSPLSALFTALKDVMPKIQGPLGDVAQVVATRLVPQLGSLLVALTPVLPVIAELVDAFAKGLAGAIPVVTGLLNILLPIVSSLVGFMEQLPGPVLAAGAALLILGKSGVPVGGILGTVADNASNLIMKLTGIGGGGVATVAAAGIGEAGSAATAAVGGASTGFTGLAASVAGLLGAGGLATVGAVAGAAAFGIWSLGKNATPQAIVAASDLTGTLNQTTGAMTSQTDASIKLNLLHQGMAAKASEFGVSLETLTKASEGNAAAQRQVNDAVNKYHDAANAAASGQINLSAMQSKVLTDGYDLQHMWGNQSGEIKKLIASQKDWLIATDAVNVTSKTLKGSLSDFSTVLSKNGADTDQNSAAWLANKGALDQVGAASLAYIQTLDGRYGPSSLKATEATHTTVDSLISAAEQMGMNQSDAETYAASILNIPVSAITQIEAETAAAATKLQTIHDQINGIAGTHYVNISVQTSGLGATGHNIDANGGMHGPKAYANGGMMAAANGLGVGPGMYKGSGRGMLVQFAEGETNWEAFISGRFGQERRNTDLWLDAGAKLGALQKLMGGGNSKTYNLNVQQSTVDPQQSLDAMLQALRFQTA